MLHVFDRLTHHHDFPMVALASLICVLGCLSSALVAGHVLAAKRALCWTLLLGTSFAATAWSTHFVAMLAYRFSVPIKYEVGPTLLSLFLGLCIVIVGFHGAVHWRERPAARVLGGATVGAGVLVLHYVGMVGVSFSGTFVYTPELVLVSVATGVGLGAGALGVMFKNRGTGHRNRYVGALLLFLMIVSLHFVGMAAMEVSLELDAREATTGWPRTALVFGVSIVFFAVLSIGIAAAMVDRRMTAYLTHLARHDVLTDLPNRRYFGELSQAMLERSRRLNTRFSILAIDLDDLKGVNDTYGHAAGDAFIRNVAQRIGALVDDADVFARLGGDEFVLIGVDTGTNDTTDRVTRMYEALVEPVPIGGTEILAGMSVGVARYPADGDDIETLLRNADTALYRAKANGKGTSIVFEPFMNAEHEARRQMETRLRLALENGSLSVAYQPLVASDDRRPVCCEALLRWADEELGNVRPDLFVPIAERTGLIVPIGEFVLERACHDATTWPGSVHVAVNLSAVQFARDGLVDTVGRVLAASGLPGERLELEITESLIIDDRARAVRILEQLRGLGVQVAMDDFGTGYSSLSYLQSFKFSKIKIDRSFVSDIEDGAHDAAIVRAAIAMGKSLGMRVVAEGVETDLQADLLAELRCDELQGYLISKPMPATDVATFLAASPAGDRAGSESADDSRKAA